MQQGVERTRNSNPDYLLFTDADIEHDEANLADLIAIATERECDLASFMVRLRSNSFAEKLLIPAFVFFFFKLYPPRWTADSASATAGAAGGCMLVRPQALERAGGLQAIRSQIIDDCALARAIKRSGGRLFLGTTEKTVSLRGYGSFAEVGRMIARTAFNQLQHSILLLLAAVLGMLLIYVAPIALLFSRVSVAAALAAGACVAMCIAYWPSVRLYNQNSLWVATLPLAALFYVSATIASALNYWRGRGGLWKGRAQDTAVPNAAETPRCKETSAP
jgi:hopene-associated glycosyltransferase HpnB